MKAAVDLVLNRGVGLPDSINGWDLVRRGMSGYLTMFLGLYVDEKCIRIYLCRHRQPRHCFYSVSRHLRRGRQGFQVDLE